MTPSGSSRLTTLCGSLSLHPVNTGALMHRAGYAALGLDFTYIPFQVRNDDLAGALQGMRALGIRGFGVSMPYKQAVLPLLDRVDGLAGRIGAVNTVVNDDGLLVGYNTDSAGSVAALSECSQVLDARILVVGAGGAARAVAAGLLSAGGHVELANRTASHAEELASELESSFGKPVRFSGLERLHATGEFDILVNASSAGMDGYGEFPWKPTAANRRLIVMDIVYKPLTTALIQQCRALGMRCIGGSRMLLHQAARQFELYTHHPAPLEAMNAALSTALESPA